MKPKMLASEAADFLNISLQALHKQLKTKALDFTKNQNRVFFEHDTAKQIFKLSFKPTCWSWLNLKGGVGKTQLSFSTAIRLTLYGARVAVIDLDQQGNFTQACNIDADNHPVLIDIMKNEAEYKISDCMVNVIPGLDILPSRIENAVIDSFITMNRLNIGTKLKKYIDELKLKYDFIFLDNSPSIGACVSAGCCGSDYVIMPVDPEKFSISGLNITINELEHSVVKEYGAQYQVKIVLNKYDARTSLSHKMLSTFFEDKAYRERMFKSFIRTSQELPNSISQGKSIYDSLRNSGAKDDIDLLAREIMECTMLNSVQKTERVASSEEVEIA
ncbi:MAG: ParA family protein [Rickettsiaceae bacterium]|nr:ParA family protein [Rickettsiaceae bacterium]